MNVRRRRHHGLTLAMCVGCFLITAAALRTEARQLQTLDSEAAPVVIQIAAARVLQFQCAFQEASPGIGIRYGQFAFTAPHPSGEDLVDVATFRSWESTTDSPPVLASEFLIHSHPRALSHITSFNAWIGCHLLEKAINEGLGLSLTFILRQGAKPILIEIGLGDQHAVFPLPS